MYFRGNDVGTDAMFPDQTAPATVSAFQLDTYEVTVGRFRAFVEAGRGTQANPPAPGSGAHANIAGTQWDESWNPGLPVDTATLISKLPCSQGASWTSVPGANESLPINCVSWYEAFAFCIWDGGYLPTEAEWNYAAAAGDEQRAYAFSSPPGSLTIDCSYANYNRSPVCSGGTGSPTRVGSHSPKGDGMWGHADLTGNVNEWVIDWSGNYPMPCDDCANLVPSTNRVQRGGNYFFSPSYARTAYRWNLAPDYRNGVHGFRCARPMM